MSSKKHKYLVIRYSSMGDIVLCTPVFRALKKQLGAEVHFITKASQADLLKNNSFIDKIWAADQEPAKLQKALKGEQFDGIVDLQNNLRSWKFKKSFSCPKYTFKKLNAKKWLLTKFKINTLPNKHIVDRYFDCISTLGIKNDGQGLDFKIDASDAEKAKKSCSDLSNNYDVLVLGATHFTKQISDNIAKEIISKSERPLVLLGGKDVQKRGQQLSAGFQDRVLNLCGSLSVNESAAVMSLAKNIISSDTGMMHIAAALQKPIASVWGNTVPAFGMYPYYGKYEVEEFRSEVNDLACRPCSKIGFKRCPKGHFKCMEEQKTQDIMSWVNRSK